jgi:hypothetical protein
MMFNSETHNVVLDNDNDFLVDYHNDIVGDWAVEFDDLNDIGFDLDIENNTLILNSYGLRPEIAMQSHYYRPQIMLAMIESLRMIRHVEWLDGTLERYHPADIIHIGRICVADTHVHKIMTAWDVKCDGDDTLWKHILCSDHADMALSYENALDNGLTQHQSMACAFNMWFSGDERLRDCDHDVLNLMDNMLDDNGTFGHKKIKSYVVNYLTIMVGDDASYIDKMLQDDVMFNPYYRDVSDVINESHLSQIVSDMDKTRVGRLVFQDSALASRFAICD